MGKYKYNLTEAEIAVLRLIVRGLSNAEIAREAGISYHTAKAHVAAILRKLEVANKLRAAIKAIVEELV